MLVHRVVESPAHADIVQWGLAHVLQREPYVGHRADSPWHEPGADLAQSAAGADAHFQGDVDIAGRQRLGAGNLIRDLNDLHALHRRLVPGRGVGHQVYPIWRAADDPEWAGPGGEALVPGRLGFCEGFRFRDFPQRQAQRKHRVWRAQSDSHLPLGHGRDVLDVAQIAAHRLGAALDGAHVLHGAQQGAGVQFAAVGENHVLAQCDQPVHGVFAGPGAGQPRDNAAVLVDQGQRVEDGGLGENARIGQALVGIGRLGGDDRRADAQHRVGAVGGTV